MANVGERSVRSTSCSTATSPRSACSKPPGAGGRRAQRGRLRIKFCYYSRSGREEGGASAGACDFIKSVADELAPKYAGDYLLESVEVQLASPPIGSGTRGWG